MTNPSTILELSKERIESDEFWTQNTLARDEVAYGTEPDSTGATCWCAEGAVRRECANLGVDPMRPLEILTMAAQGLFGNSYVYVNDKLGHDATVKMFGHAVNVARGMGE